MDIGLDGPEDYAALQKTLAMIQVIGQLGDSLPEDPALLGEPGSDLADLMSALPEPPVDLRLSISAGLATARAALLQISGFIVDGVPTTPSVLHTLVRSALLGVGRVVYVLGPPSAEARQENARMVLRQEGNSLMRAYSAFEQKGVSILVPLTAICRAPAQDGGLGQRESYHSLRTVSPKGT